MLLNVLSRFHFFVELVRYPFDIFLDSTLAFVSLLLYFNCLLFVCVDVLL